MNTQSNQRQETWEQARKRLEQLPEPERSQELKVLKRLHQHVEQHQKNPMAAPVQNPHIIYRSPPLPEDMRAQLLALNYAPHATELLMQGLPITYNRNGRQIVEYPDGRRIWVQYSKIYDADGQFQCYYYSIAGELESARRLTQRPNLDDLLKGITSELIDGDDDWEGIAGEEFW